MGIADEVALYALGYWMHENHPSRISGLCLNDIQRKTPCDECSAVCPAGLSIHEKNPNWKGCTDCGLCVTACPTQAINASGASCKQVDSAVDAAQGCVVLACRRYEGAADAVLSCLASLSWDEIAAVALRIPVVLKTGPCKTCPDVQAASCLRETIRRVKDFYGSEEFSRRVFPRIPSALAQEHAQGRASGVQRRRMFSTFADSVKEGTTRLSGNEEPPSVSRSRAMLLDALVSLPLEERPAVRWLTLSEDGACRGCGICVKMCPHGALSFAADIEGTHCSDDSVPRFLAHDASRCTQCGLCYLSCPEDNLGGWVELRTSEVPALACNPIHVARCEKCGRFFKEEKGRTICPACSRFRFRP